MLKKNCRTLFFMFTSYSDLTIPSRLTSKTHALPCVLFILSFMTLSTVSKFLKQNKNYFSGSSFDIQSKSKGLSIWLFFQCTCLRKNVLTEGKVIDRNSWKTFRGNETFFQLSKNSVGRKILRQKRPKNKILKEEKLVYSLFSFLLSP